MKASKLTILYCTCISLDCHCTGSESMHWSAENITNKLSQWPTRMNQYVQLPLDNDIKTHMYTVYEIENMYGVAIEL